MNKIKIFILFGIVCLIFGNTFLAISLGLNAGASPLFFASARFILAGVSMLIFLVLSRKVTLAQIKAVLIRSAILSIFMTSGTFGFMFLAQTRVSSGFMARLDAAGPIVTAILVAIVLKKRISKSHIFAFLLGTGGIFLIATPGVTGEPLYLAFAFLSVIFYAIANAIYPKLFPKRENPVVISALQAILGGLLLMIFAFFVEEISLPKESYGPLIYLTVAGSIVGHTVILILLRDAGPVFASAWLYVAPVIATFSGALVLGERITVVEIVGTLIALVGVFILFKTENLNSKKEIESVELQEDRVS